MPAKRYSAGAVFLQVVPVFANVQRAIESEAEQWNKALGDQMEKSGDKAGRRAGKAASKSMGEELKKASGDFERDFRRNIDGINSALGGIDAKRLSNPLRREIAQIKKELSGLKDLDLAVDVDKRKADVAIAELEGRVRAFRDEAKVIFRADIDKALKGFAKVEAAKDAISDPVQIEVRTDKAERVMSAFERNIKKSMSRAAEATRGSLSEEVRNLGKELDHLGDLNVGVDISAGRLHAEAAAIAAQLRALRDTDVDIDARFDAGRAWAELSSFMAAVEAADNREIDIRADVDSNAARRNLLGLVSSGDSAANTFRSFNAIMLASASIGPALVPTLGAIAGGLLAIGPAAAVATTSIGGLLIGFSGIGDAISALGAQQDQAAAIGQRAARTEQSSAKAIRDAQDGITDARRDAARAAEDAAERVSDAQKAAARANRDAAEAVRDARRQAAESAEDAAKRVADAREEAAQAVRDALESQREAQEDYRDSVLAVRDAEQALKEARANARGTGADIERSIRENALAIDQALLDEFNTTVTYNATMSDGSATNAEQEQARIDMEEARLRMEELREEQKDLAKQKKKWDKEGVNGTEEVQNAQDNLTSAIDAQRDAYKAMQKAAKEADEARREGAERVSEALADQADAQRDAARAIQDALRAQAETRADGASNVRDAIEDQNQTLADNRRAIQDAEQALIDARHSGAQATQQLNAQQIAVDNAFSKLGPAGRRFARYLFSLQPAFREFRNDIQSVLLPSIEEAIRGFLGSESGATLRQVVIDLAEGFGELAVVFSQSLQSKPWLEFFRAMGEYGPAIQESYGRGFVSFLEAMASIMTTLAPYAAAFAKGFERIMGAFAEWAGSKEGADSLRDFMGYAERIAPKVGKFLTALAAAIGNILVALAPYGEVVLEIITHILEFIAGMDTKTLGAILTAILVIVTAAQMAYGVSTIVLALLTLLSGWAGIIVFTFVGIGLALTVLYKKNEDFRNFVDKAWDRISAAISKAWKQFIKPALDEMWSALKDLWEEVLQPLFKWLGPIIVWIAEHVIPLLAAAWATQIRIIAFWIKHALIPWAKAVGAIIMWLWKKVVKPVLPWISAAFKTAFKAIKRFWNNTLKPALDNLWDLMLKLWKKVIKPVLGWIGDMFQKVFKAVKWYWKNILWPVLDLFMKSVKKLWKDFVWPFLKKVGAFFRDVFKAIKWSWNNILWPIIDLFMKAVKKLYEKYVKPHMASVKGAFEEAFRRMRWVWNNILKPVFDKIVDTALPALKKGFRTAVDAIKDIWEDLKAAIGVPIRFVLENVVNKGLIAGFNKVANFVDSTPMKEIPIPKWMQKLATGGVVGQGSARVMPGYTPGRDVHEFYSPTAGRLSLSGGEAVMRPEFTQAVGGKAGVDRLNALARRRRGGLFEALTGDLGGYWMGGVIPLTGASVSQHTSGYSGYAADLNYPGYSDYGKPVHAWNSGVISGLLYRGDESYGRWVTINHGGSKNTLYAHLSGFGPVKVGQKVSAGQVVGYVGDLGNTGTPPTSHLHFELKGGLSNFTGASTSGEASGSGGLPNPLSVLPKWLKAAYKKPIDWIKGKITDAAEGIGDRFGPIGTLLKDVALKPAKAVGDKIKSIVKDFLPSFSGIKNKLGDLLGDGKKGSVVDQVQAVAKAYGWSFGPQWSALYDLVSRESSWDPGAENPTTTASGLFQFVDGTWQAYSGKPGHASDYSVGEQAIAGMKYIKGRYGDPIGAIGFHNANGWYRDGGVIGSQGELGAAGENAAAAGGLPYNGTMMYDAGGYLPPGLTTVVNLTGKPEPVFTNDDWASIRGGDGLGGGSIHYEPHFEGSDLTAADVAGDLNFEFKRIRRQGKYAGV